MIWHSEDLTAISRELGSDTHSGLTAEQAEERQREYGPNKLDEKPPRPWILRFLDQFKDVMVLILIGAAAVSLGLSVYNALQGREADWAEPIVILVIVVVNALISISQEDSAETLRQAVQEAYQAQTRPLPPLLGVEVKLYPDSGQQRVAEILLTWQAREHQTVEDFLGNLKN